MSNSLDLDIKNYNHTDLENFFKLNDYQEYTYADIEYREAKIREQLLNSGHVSKSMKRDLIHFLNSAKQKLVNLKQKVSTEIHKMTTLPVNTQLDTTSYKSSLYDSRENELNVREHTKFMHVQHTDFLPGKVNPLHTRVISKCLTIDTRFRSNYFTTKSSDFNFHLPVTLNRVVSMQLSSFEIPVSFYGISESNGNNYLNILVNYYDISYVEQIRYCVVVPDGNYTGQSLIDVINNNLANLSNIENAYNNENINYNIFKNVSFSIGIDLNNNGSGTGLTYFSYIADPSNSVISFELDFTLNLYGEIDNVEYSKKLGWNLGFNKSKYIFKKNEVKIPGYAYGLPVSSINVNNFSITAVSETIIEPATIRYIYLAIDDFNTSVNDLFMTAFYVSVMSPDIIARIPVQGTYFSLLMETNLAVVSEPRIYFGPVDIQRVRVRLFDDRGNVINMNNANYSFCLVFKMLYDL